jgi:hypothetical protein
MMALAGSSTTDVVLAAFDDHLRRVRGVCPEVRRSYARVAREFLEGVFGDGSVDLARLSASDVVEFVFAATGLLAHGASLKEIADLFGHRALSSTQVYAKVDIVALRDVALPWPEVTR